MINKNKILEYTSPIGISNNHYNSYRVISSAGKKSFVQAYPSKEYMQYKKNFIPYLKNLVKQFEWDMVTEFKHYYLDLIIYFDRTNCDPTNYFKVLQDVATGILYFDDKIILGRVNRVYYTYNPDCPPRIECKLYPCEYADIGIFENEDEYKQFISKCQTCKTYKNGECKTLCEYMSYKITEKIDMKTKICNKFKQVKN